MLFVSKGDSLASSGLIDYWVDVAARESENDGKHAIEDRISALSLLTEIWLSFTAFIDEKRPELPNTVLMLLKRAIRER